MCSTTTQKFSARAALALRCYFPAAEARTQEELPPGAAPGGVEAMVAIGRQRFLADVPRDLAIVGPPAGARVIELHPNDALIGLPLDVISPNSSSSDAIAQLQRDGTPRAQKLTAAERVHETAFCDDAQRNLSAVVNRARASAWDPRVGTHVFEVDAGKKFYEPYGAGHKAASPAEEKVRLEANHALHPTAVAIVRLAFLQQLDMMKALPQGDARRTIFVTNGGVAAGKGNLTGLVKELRQGVFEFGAVWDAAGEGDARENMWILQAARARGLKVVFGYAANDPMARYQDVLARAMAVGRVVDPMTYARAYTRGAENMRVFLSSPEYLAAKAEGAADAVGIFAGAFDPSTGGYPEARPLGRAGQIDAADIELPPPTAVVFFRAVDQLGAWLEAQRAAGKNVDDYATGTIANMMKWGAEP